MSKSLRFGSALSVIAAASMVGGCATPQRATGFGGPVEGSNIGAATRAALAIQANDFQSAIPLAERAVESSPTDAGFRGLLGNAYFGAGRFASAEVAYRDSLSILSNQPQVILRLALVQIAQGKNDEAVSFIEAARDVLDPADYGLALALAGRGADAIAALEPAARAINADARVRQNLALAHALTGDWTAARTIAAQDVPADQLDARIQQWMGLAKPTRASDQVAALTGIAPAASDPGQPTRLALRSEPTRMADSVPALPEPAPIPQPVAFEPAPVPASEQAPDPQFAEVAPVAAPPPAPAPVPVVVAEAPAPEVVPDFVAVSAPEAVYSAPKPPRVVKAATTRKAPPVRNASLPRASGKSMAVVQLGAYGSRERVGIAWNQITKRYPALLDYAPMTARFNSPKGVVYRLSIKGFASQQEAISRCGLLKRRGGACFVRSVAGDVPVQMASR